MRPRPRALTTCIRQLQHLGFELFTLKGRPSVMIRKDSYPPGSHVVFQDDRVVWWVGGRMSGSFSLKEAASTIA